MAFPKLLTINVAECISDENTTAGTVEKYKEEVANIKATEKSLKKVLRCGWTTRIETHHDHYSGYTVVRTELVAYSQRHKKGECETCPLATYEFAGNGQLPCGQFRCWDNC